MVGDKELTLEEIEQKLKETLDRSEKSLRELEAALHALQEDHHWGDRVDHSGNGQLVGDYVERKSHLLKQIQTVEKLLGCRDENGNFICCDCGEPISLSRLGILITDMCVLCSEKAQSRRRMPAAFKRG